MNNDRSKLSRRHLFAGAGTAGALAAVAAVLPRVAADVPAEPVAKAEPPEKGGGYQVTQHVLRYYETTRI
jgi:hypothetical protein